MPRYKVKASDGKTLTIDADDESGLDAAMQEYDSQTLKAAPAQPTPQAAPSAGPGMGERAWEGAKAGVPFLKSAEGGFDYSGAEGAGRLAGDIGGTAATVAFGVPRTLATAAGLGAAFEGSGAGPAMRKGGQAAESAIDSALATNLPSKVMGIEGLGTGVNALSRAPGALADVAANVIPYIVAGKVASGAMPKGAAPKIAPVNEGAALLQQYGGRVTPGMQSGTKAMGALDWLASKAITGQNTSEGIRQANSAAVKALLGERLPQMTEADAGRGVQGAIDAYKTSRGQRFEGAERSALDALGQGNEVGMAASKAIIDSLQKRGVPIDQKGFVPGETPMTASIDRPTATLLQTLAQELRSADAQGVINARRNLRANAPGILKAAPESSAMPARGADAAMKKALNRAVFDANPEAGMKYAGARKEYARTVEPVRKLTEAMAKENASPEQFTQRALTPKQGTGNLEMFKKYMSPEEFKPLQEGLARSIMQDVMNPQSLGDVSANRLNSALSKDYRHATPYLEPNALRGLQDAQKMLETARIADTAVPQVSAGGNNLNMQLGAGGTALGLAMMGQPMPLLGLGALEAAAPMYLNLPQMLKRLPSMPQTGNAVASGYIDPGVMMGARLGAAQ